MEEGFGLAAAAARKKKYRRAGLSELSEQGCREAAELYMPPQLHVPGYSRVAPDNAFVATRGSPPRGSPPRGSPPRDSAAPAGASPNGAPASAGGAAARHIEVEITR